ncbi:MAG: hypothetical protein EAZ27_10025 [Cytophagales bacterium]|nr:MAG: hypothetical protein EAZ27_10025 [Cytophagales bacterium]
MFLPYYSPNLIERVWWFIRKMISHKISSLKERMATFWKIFSHYQIPNEEMI